MSFIKFWDFVTHSDSLAIILLSIYMYEYTYIHYIRRRSLYYDEHALRIYANQLRGAQQPDEIEWGFIINPKHFKSTQKIELYTCDFMSIYKYEFSLGKSRNKSNCARYPSYNSWHWQEHLSQSVYT